MSYIHMKRYAFFATISFHILLQSITSAEISLTSEGDNFVETDTRRMLRAHGSNAQRVGKTRSRESNLIFENTYISSSRRRERIRKKERPIAIVLEAWDVDPSKNNNDNDRRDGSQGSEQPASSHTKETVGLGIDLTEASINEKIPNQISETLPYFTEHPSEKIAATSTPTFSPTTYSPTYSPTTLSPSSSVDDEANDEEGRFLSQRNRCATFSNRRKCKNTNGCSWTPKGCVNTPSTLKCLKWSNKKRKCRNKGCRWNTLALICTGIDDIPKAQDPQHVMAQTAFPSQSPTDAPTYAPTTLSPTESPSKISRYESASATTSVPPMSSSSVKSEDILVR